MTVQMKRLALTIGLLGAIAPILPATANPVLEVEASSGENNTFAERETVAPGSTHVLGGLSLGDTLEDADYSFSGTLEPDGVDTYEIPGLSADTPFYTWIDNSDSGIDTVLGVFDGDTLLLTDDDSSPVGSGLASGIGGTTNSDGTISLSVTGFPDFDFDGMADPPPDFGFDPGIPAPDFPGEAGAYDIQIQLGVNSISNADPEAADYTFTEELVVGEVNMVTLDDLPPSEPFIVWIDNAASGVDTVLGVFDESGELIDFNDDASPYGNGLGSAITGFVNADGSLDLRITGFPDFNFDGDYADDAGGFPGGPMPFEPTGHGAAGDYELYVTLGVDSIQGDVDFLSFPGLEPGSEFAAEITLANFDPILGWYDDEGMLIIVDDDGGQNVLPRLVGTVPSSGVVNVAVSAFGDFEFQGEHASVSDYVLKLEISPE
jgi:hypothetical protein